MEILLTLTVGALCLICFRAGARLGCGAQKQPHQSLPASHPMQTYKARRLRKEAITAQTKFDAIMENIDTYDGTANGQKQIPGG